MSTKNYGGGGSGMRVHPADQNMIKHIAIHHGIGDEAAAKVLTAHMADHPIRYGGMQQEMDDRIAASKKRVAPNGPYSRTDPDMDGDSHSSPTMDKD